MTRKGKPRENNPGQRQLSLDLYIPATERYDGGPESVVTEVKLEESQNCRVGIESESKSKEEQSPTLQQSQLPGIRNQTKQEDSNLLVDSRSEPVRGQDPESVKWTNSLFYTSYLNHATLEGKKAC